MLTEERHRIILELLETKKIVRIQELVEVLSSSESTIRRDLSQLERKKKLKRVHGGASLLNQKKEELSIDEKLTKNLEEKDRIAKYAATLIKDGDCIYLDAGTTINQMIPYISAHDLTVVTNGLTHLEQLLAKNINTYLVGGCIKQKTRALIGHGAIDSLNKYRFDKIFLGVNGIHVDYGYTTPDPEEAAVKATAINLGQNVFVLADHTKFHEVTFSKVADLEEATIITNETDPETIEEFRKKTNIEVVTE
ncbi:MAG TPA: DeoR/GlpR family DNA-binding transcription regulator [Bacillus sp. (in: firmicutes)]|uniref:DeoR/GlpR family DNA-binding transcription regulator n=1 Tax=Bacillus litorisediminis TaxID=2922713 RepID=UPI001FAB9767|nr:DeoR/GlpR family DNA-binding transcription regulator [Bacillus litorisediminis]HWO76664.1 DeoR/GlpR family DNA-binding transcription regulator [Bacillus sp. (in: firmicutes)]